MEFRHKPVLLEETITNLRIRPDGIYVDGTLGGGGHSSRIVELLSEKGRLIGIDQDDAAMQAAAKRLEPYGQRVRLVRSNFCQMAQVLKECGSMAADGILLDLGVSSYQLDTLERGFSYKYDTVLDMRMDRRQTLTAKEIVNTYSMQELFHIIREYGEEKFAQNIARHIVRAREKEEIETTGQLNEIIRAAIPAKVRAGGGHPSKKTFQAIRIACNRELEVLQDALDSMTDLLSPGGRLCVITFHSLEDRIVKTAMRGWENPCICPPEFPVCTCGRKSKGRVITRKPILPTDGEMTENKRAKSAKLRVFEKRE